MTPPTCSMRRRRASTSIAPPEDVADAHQTMVDKSAAAAEKLREFADTVANASLAELQESLAEFQNIEEFKELRLRCQRSRRRVTTSAVRRPSVFVYSPSRSSMASSRRQWGRTLT